MFAQWRIREDAVGAGAGSGSVSPPPAPPGGGSAYLIDPEEAEFAKRVRMLELKVRKQAAEDALARRAPAFGGGGGDSEGGAAVGAGAGPAVTGPASDEKKKDSGSGSSSSREGMKYNKVRACCFSV